MKLHECGEGWCKYKYRCPSFYEFITPIVLWKRLKFDEFNFKLIPLCKVEKIYDLRLGIPPCLTARGFSGGLCPRLCNLSSFRRFIGLGLFGVSVAVGVVRLPFPGGFDHFLEAELCVPV